LGINRCAGTRSPFSAAKVIFFRVTFGSVTSSSVLTLGATFLDAPGRAPITNCMLSSM
jgi:hypothetical protein